MAIMFVLLYAASAIVFALAAFDGSHRINLVAVGLLLWVCVPLIKTAMSVY